MLLTRRAALCLEAERVGTGIHIVRLGTDALGEQRTVDAHANVRDFAALGILCRDDDGGLALHHFLLPLPAVTYDDGRTAWPSALEEPLARIAQFAVVAQELPLLVRLYACLLLVCLRARVPLRDEGERQASAKRDSDLHRHRSLKVLTPCWSSVYGGSQSALAAFGAAAEDAMGIALGREAGPPPRWRAGAGGRRIEVGAGVTVESAAEGSPGAGPDRGSSSVAALGAGAISGASTADAATIGRFFWPALRPTPKATMHATTARATIPATRSLRARCGAKRVLGTEMPLLTCEALFQEASEGPAMATTSVGFSELC